jgi:chromatin remodeling complex protein RSC6
MVKAKKSVKTTASKSKAKKSVKSTSSKTAAVKSTPVKETAPVQTTTAPAKKTAVVAESTLSSSFSEFMSKLQQVSASLTSLRSEFRALEKKASRELRQAQKIIAKRNRKSSQRKPSGFTKPTLISNELAAFLKVPQGTQMARTEVTKEINKYVVAHKLKDKDNGRKIHADKALSKLLNLKKDDELTYFNLQSYMKGHFAKASSTTA